MASKIAYAIARESSDDRTLQNQYDNIHKVAKELGYKIVQEFGENVTGDATKKDGADPDFIEELRVAIKAKKPDAIFCYWIDRLTRTTFKQGAYLNEFSVTPKIPIYFTRKNKWTIDPTTNVIDFDFLAELSSDTTPQKERENIVARTAPQRVKNGLDGYYIGHLSDGYCVKEKWGTWEDGHRRKIKEIVIDTKRRPVIERIFNLYIKGNSNNKIASILNAEDVPTTNRYRTENPEMFGHKQTYVGKDRMKRERSKAKWNGSLVAAILSNPWYKGIRKFKGKELHHEPIVSEEIWDMASSLREEKKVSFRESRIASKHNFLLSNLIFCSRCGSKLYGHYTGLNNHYYCSSIDNLSKCGLKGICKENIEAIIYKTIKENVLRSVINNTDDSITSFFKLDKEVEDDLNEKIHNNNIIINDKKKSIIDLKEQILFHFDEQSHYRNQQDMLDFIRVTIEQKRQKADILKEEITKLEAENRSHQRKLSSSSDIKEIVNNILGDMEMEDIRLLFNQAIDKIVLFNTEKTNDVIRVIYKNGKKDEIIYSSGLLKGKYIKLASSLYYDEETNILQSTFYPLFITIVNNKYVYFLNEECLDGLKLRPYDEVTSTDCFKFDSGFSIDDFIRLTRDTIIALEYERLEEEPEIATVQRERQRNWRKKYNTGRPTSEPYIIHNETYEEIQVKRMRLYRKAYKIKNRKTISAEEKQKRLEDIKRQLDILSVQVPYIKPRKKRSKSDEEFASEPLD